MMDAGRVHVAVWMMLAAVACGCASPAPNSEPRAAGQAVDAPRVRTTPKRVVAAALGEPAALGANVNALGIPVPALGGVVGLISSGLAVTDDKGALSPQLAEAVPTVENG